MKREVLDEENEHRGKAYRGEFYPYFYGWLGKVFYMF